MGHNLIGGAPFSLQGGGGFRRWVKRFFHYDPADIYIFFLAASSSSYLYHFFTYLFQLYLEGNYLFQQLAATNYLFYHLLALNYLFKKYPSPPIKWRPSYSLRQ